jgi:hypothetical protein
MIYVVYPRGCYGSYFSQCLYQYTVLTKEQQVKVSFDAHGSSHHARDNSNLRSVISPMHFEEYRDKCMQGINKSSNIVVIMPNSEHCLDYINNHFVKHGKQNLVAYISSIFQRSEITEKLKNYWGYDQEFDENVPVWIMREFISMWIVDSWQDGYNIEKYKKLSGIQISTQDIFYNFINSFLSIAEYLNLKVTVDPSTILANHNIFIKKQSYHNSQSNCTQWAKDILSNGNTINPCQTIFDEAYVQLLLKKDGYEIQCYNLNTFSEDAQSLRKIICKQN